MIDSTERQLWYRAFLEEGVRVAGRRVSLRRMKKWARAMSLIAEQFVENDDADLVDAP